MNRRLVGRTRETALVELVSPAGDPVGATTVAHAHDWPGVLHRAFSVLLFDALDGSRMLLQRRSASKTRFASRWANACCGHPEPGEDVLLAGGRRLGEEIGARGVDLTGAGVHVYRAGDPANGRVEHEYDHVLIGRIRSDVLLTPDPAEVAELAWIRLDDLRDDLSARPARYAPWLSGVVTVWFDTVSAEPTGGR